MKRSVILGLVVLFGGVGEAEAQRRLSFGSNNGGGGALTYYIGTSALGSASVTTVLGPGVVEIDEFSSVLLAQFMPEVGIPNFGNRDNNSIRPK